MRSLLLPPLALVTTLACTGALAAGTDVGSLYELSAAGTPARVKAGSKGTFKLEIRPRGDAHISEEAPLKVELAGKNLKLAKDKLARADAATPSAPRFEVPFTAEAAGAGAVEVKATFFVCTANLCERQQKVLSVPVAVD
ncbi:MAG: hypothetical protein RL653_755 [Pseudomonadota bacterium]|jgi:hypothetical protein